MSTIVVSEAPAGSGSSRGFRFAMLLPGGLVTFFLILFALGLVLFLALRGNDGSLLGDGFTADNFITVVSDPLYWTVTLRSLVIAGLVTLATVVTAYPVAYYLAFHAGRRRGLLLFLVTLPFWTSYLLRVFAWKIVIAFNGVLICAVLDTGLSCETTMALVNTSSAVLLRFGESFWTLPTLRIYVALVTIP